MMTKRFLVTTLLWWPKTFLVTIMSFPFPHPSFFPLLCFPPPPNGDQNLFDHHFVWSPQKKYGVTNGNPLGTRMEHVANKWKIENNPSLLGAKFNAILLHT
jgi:hypothetical protein